MNFRFKISLFIIIFLVASDFLSSTSNIIPRGKIINIDGVEAKNEWSDAKTLSIHFKKFGMVTIKVKHDEENLNILYYFNVNPKNILCFPEIYIDPENNGGETWQSDDWWFHVSATDCLSRGKYDDYSNCRIEHNDWQAYPNFKPGDNTEPLYTFEIIIPLNKAGIKKGEEFGLSFAGGLFIPGKDKSKELRELFPKGALIGRPSSWAKWLINQE